MNAIRYEIGAWYDMTDVSPRVRFRLNGDSTITVRVWLLAPGVDQDIKRWLHDNMGRGIWERAPWQQPDGVEYLDASWWRT